MRITVQDQIKTAYLKGNNPFTKKTFGTSEEVVDDEGNKTYEVEILAEGEYEVETLRVSVKAKDNPVKDIAPMSAVKFTGLVLNFGTFKDSEGRNRKFYSLSADKIARA